MRFYFWVLLALPLFVFSVVFTFSYKQPIDLLDPTDFQMSRFIDSINGGNSEVDIRKTDSAYSIQCILREGSQYPYAGLEFTKPDGTLFNLNNYTITLRLSVNYNVRLSVRLSQFIDNYTDSLVPMSYLTAVKSFGLNAGDNELNLNVADVNEIQDWWFSHNPSMINKTGNVTYDKIRRVWLYAENSTPLNKPLQISLQEFSLHYQYMPLLYRFSVIAILYYVVLLLVVWNVKKVKYIMMPIELSRIGNKIPETQQQILHFIGSNYKNSDLKLDDVAQAIGISKDHVTELLRKHCELTFRQYLNQVRLEEAKHLLRNSDFQIAEIAFQIGYNNIQHFNRVFKDYTSFTPTAFRDLK